MNYEINVKITNYEISVKITNYEISVKITNYEYFPLSCLIYSNFSLQRGKKSGKTGKSYYLL